MSTRHPDVKDLGLVSGERGCLTPSDYQAMTPAEAVEQATMAVLEAQSRIIARLTAECAELRKRLAVLR